MKKIFIAALVIFSSCQKDVSVNNVPPFDLDADILFMSRVNHPEGERSEMVIINTDGKNRRVVSNRFLSFSWPVISHNGKKIAFLAAANYESDLYITGVDGQGEKLIAKNQWNQPAFSPDDKRITFIKDNPNLQGYQDIYTVDIDGGNELRLTNQNNNFSPLFLPDNSGIIFIATLTTDIRSPDWWYGIYRMNIDGSNKKLLTPPGKSFGSLSISPDGKKIAATTKTSCNCNELAVMNTDGSGLKQITFSGAHCTPANWSPDSRKLAYTKVDYNAGYGSIYTIGIDGLGNNKLFDGAGTGQTSSAWSSDGKYLLFTSASKQPVGQQPSWKYSLQAGRVDGALITSIIENQSMPLLNPIIIKK